MKRRAVSTIGLIILLGLLSFVTGDRAPGDVYIPRYKSFDIRENKIDGPNRLNGFFNALDRCIQKKQRKVVITHIGDSHIQADFLTHTTRTLFQKTFGNGGRGFVFPYRLIRSNSPLNLGIAYNGNWEGCKSVSSRDHCNFGITGATATTYDSFSTIRLNPNLDKDMNYEFNRVKLFNYSSPHSFNVRALSPDSTAMHADVLPTSESISYLFFDENQDSLWLGLEKQDSQRYYQFYGASFENDNPGVVYHAIGLNGAYAKSYLRNTFFDEQLASLKSDLIILSLGTNDAYMYERMFCQTCFKENYEKLLLKVMQNNPNADILLTTPGDIYIRRRYHNRNIGQVVTGIKELADKYNLAVWDFNTLMGGDYAIKKWRNEGLAQYDLIHYTEEGYMVQGMLLYSGIMKAYEDRFNDK